MPDLIRYDILTQKALRSVVREVLGDAARKKALPGEHHFYISFDTQADGVEISSRLLAQYPEEMTIILQHQFWDLKVSDSGFEVGLSFGGVPERLVVPFEAISGFFDPSVQFGLQFEEVKEGGQDNARPDAVETTVIPKAAAPKGSDGKMARPPLQTRPKTSLPPVAPTQNIAPDRTEKAEPAKADAKADPKADPKAKIAKPAGAEVVRLDRFRKK